MNSFFAANGEGVNAKFKHKDDVQKWLDIIKGTHIPTQIDSMKTDQDLLFRILTQDYFLFATFILVSSKCCIMLRNEKLVNRNKQ